MTGYAETNRLKCKLALSISRPKASTRVGSDWPPEKGLVQVRPLADP
jgi:hypothetical protein